MLTDITDNPYYSVCAKCNLTNIFEVATHCPNCGYDLGPTHTPLCCTITEVLPLKPPQDFVSSFLTYDCYFIGQLGCRIQGDGPTLVTLIINPEIVGKILEGKLIESVGEESHVMALTAQGFRPIVGDVLVSVEDLTVVHLNSMEVLRLIRRQKKKLKTTLMREASTGSAGGGGDGMSVSSHRSAMERRIKVSFRRHMVDNVDEIIKHDQRAEAYLLQEKKANEVSEGHKVRPLTH